MKLRLAYYDNLKYILMFLVVFGHLLEKVKSPFYIEYFYIYTFSMPVFIFISGYFSNLIKKKEDLFKLVLTLLIPYILFQFIYALFHNHLYDKEIDMFSPHWGMWYLISLFVWRLMLNTADKFKYSLLILFILALAIGYTDADKYLSISRTFVFAPFFYMGYLISKKKYNLSKLTDYKLFGIVILISFGLLLIYLNIDLNVRWLWGSYSYEKLNEQTIGFLYRASLFLLSIIISLAFLSIIPKRKTFFTESGLRTINIYLWHFLIILFIKYSEMYEINKYVFREYHSMTLILFLIITFLIVTILSSKWIDKIIGLHHLNKLFERKK